MFEQIYQLSILPFFEEELGETVDYIQRELRNPQAADKLVDDVFASLDERLKAPLAFEPYPSTAEVKPRAAGREDGMAVVVGGW